MALIYLIRHPHTQINLATSSQNWDLSDEGWAQTAALLKAPFWPYVDTIYSSRELKTISLAKEAALRYNITVIPRSAFGEVNRNAHTAPDQDSYEAAVQALFAAPDAVHPHGWENAASVLKRFKKEFNQILTWHSEGQTVVIVSHGLALNLFLADLKGEPPSMDRWRKTPFAGVATIERSTMKVISDFVSAPYDAVPLR